LENGGKYGFATVGVDSKSIEAFGSLHEGDEVAVRGTVELRAGSHVVTKQASDAAATGK
jgi:hypothetical protein